MADNKVTTIYSVGLHQATEEELVWRYRFADGEIGRIPSHAQSVENRSKRAAIINDQPAQVPTARDKEGRVLAWTDDMGFRSGVVFCAGESHGWGGEHALDFGPIEAVRRARYIDRKLAACSAHTRAVLWLALGARPRAGLVQLGRWGNVAPFTEAVQEAFRRAPAHGLHSVEWVEAQLGRLDHREVQRQAEAMVIKAGNEYRDARP